MPYIGTTAPVEGITFRVRAASADVVHLFCKDCRAHEEKFEKALSHVKVGGMLWVSWPKKASKVPTDITEDTIRELCLPLGFVDVKVCAVDQTWSGLKLMIRKELR